MNKNDMIDNFADNIEKQRMELGLSQAEMAHKLNLSLSSYKLLINGQTKRIDVYTMVKLYELTGKFAFEFLGISDVKTNVVSKLSTLSQNQLEAIHNVMEQFLD